MTVLLDANPERVLVVSTRPGSADAELAGSIARWVDEGASAHLVCCTSGDAEGADAGADPLEVAVVREHEQRAAADILGYQGVRFLHRPDGAIANDLALREQLVRVIRAVRPDTLVAPDPGWLIGPDGRINEADRRETGFAAIDALRPSSQAMAFPELATAEGLAPWVVDRLMLSGAATVNVLVDISATLERKVAALSAHASVSADPTTVTTGTRLRASETGKRLGLAAAEAFTLVQLEPASPA